MKRASSKNPLRIVATPEAASMSLVSWEAMNELDMKLAQIRAITDLIQTADADSLYENTIELAAYSVGLLVDECQELVKYRTLTDMAANGVQS
jgi:hypothetical protein